MGAEPGREFSSATGAGRDNEGISAERLLRTGWSDDARERTVAAAIIAKDESTTATELICRQLLVESTRAVQGTLVDALKGREGNEALLLAAVSSVLDPDRAELWVRDKAVAVLEGLSSDAADRELCHVLADDPHDSVRLHAARAMRGRSFSPRVRQALHQALQDRSGKVRLSAAVTLARAGNARDAEALSAAAAEAYGPARIMLRRAAKLARRRPSEGQ